MVGPPWSAFGRPRCACRCGCRPGGDPGGRRPTGGTRWWRRVGVADVVQVSAGDQRIPVAGLDAGGGHRARFATPWVCAHGYSGEQATLGRDRRPGPATLTGRPVRTSVLGRPPDQGPWRLSSPDGGRGKQTTHERKTTARRIAAAEVRWRGRSLLSIVSENPVPVTVVADAIRPARTGGTRSAGRRQRPAARPDAKEFHRRQATFPPADATSGPTASDEGFSGQVRTAGNVAGQQSEPGPNCHSTTESEAAIVSRTSGT